MDFCFILRIFLKQNSIGSRRGRFDLITVRCDLAKIRLFTSCEFQNFLVPIFCDEKILNFHNLVIISFSYLGWIPGILGFSVQMCFTQILAVYLNQIWKLFRMIPKSPMSSRIWGYSQKILRWIWNILILILRVLLTAEKSSD